MPAQIQSKVLNHPDKGISWISILSEIDDPRQLSCNTYHSVTMVLCEAKNWEEMYYLAEGEDFSKWLGSYVDLSMGIF